MNEYQSLNHTKWECKYHVVFIPKYRRKVLYGSLRKHLGSMFRELARQKECEIGEGHLMVDHVHMLVPLHDNLGEDYRDNEGGVIRECRDHLGGGGAADSVRPKSGRGRREAVNEGFL